MTFFKLKSTILLLVAATLSVFGQKGIEDGSKFGQGEDSIRCIRNLSIYREFVKHNNYGEAVKPWKVVFNECPAASKNIYIDGAKIYSWRIQKEDNPEVQNQLVDTLMLLYDKRIKYYGDKGYVLARKGIDLLRYRRDNLSDIKEGYDYLSEAIKIEKSKSPAAAFATQMTASITLFKYNEISAEQVVEDFATAMNYIDQDLLRNPNDRTMNNVKDVIEQNFAASGAATCQNLVALFLPQFEATPNDPDLLKKITNFLQETGCEDDSLYVQASENLYELEPSASSAYNLAKLFLKKEEYEKAAEYYLQVIAGTEEGLEKAKYYYELALVTNKLGEPVKAREYALNAIENNPGYGDPYILIGNLYVTASNSCGSNDFEKKAVFWAAIDKYIKAKNIDPGVAATANELINRYSQYFPNNEDAFFYGFTDGKPYTVGCWINERTTVRTSK